jgi:hypothetical protein
MLKEQEQGDVQLMPGLAGFSSKCRPVPRTSICLYGDTGLIWMLDPILLVGRHYWDCS